MSRLSSALSPARSALAIVVTVALAAAGAVASSAAQADARPVVKVTPTTQSEQLAPLAPATAAIEGTVKNAKGAALVGAGVSAWAYDEDEGWSQEPSFSTETTTGGTYSLAVAPGTYAVKFTPPVVAQPLYVPEYWKNTAYIWNSSDLTVEEGETLKKIDASLDATSFVTGKITKVGGGALTQAEREGVSLTVCEGDTDGEDFYINDECVGTSTIAADGTYKISGFGPGRYTVYLSSSDFLNSYYPASQYADEASSFTIKAGATVKNKNFAVSTGASITGVISTSLDILQGASISAFLQGTEIEEECCDDEYVDSSKTVKTDATGHYSIGGLWPGDYKLYADGAEFGSATYSGEWYDNTYTESQARVLTLADLTSTASADVQLAASSLFGGNVVIKNSSTPAAGAVVELYRFTTTKNKYTEFYDYREVAADGSFHFADVTPGKYAVRITSYDEDSPYASYWYGAGLGGSIFDALVVPLDPAGGLEFAVEAIIGGIYTGKVVGTDGPLEGVSVNAQSDFGNDWDDWDDSKYTETDAAGNFTIPGLIPGAYTISVDPSDLAYDDLGDDSGIHYVAKEFVAAPVAEASLPTDVGTISLDEASVLTGIVTGPTGKPVKNASLSAEVRTPGGDYDWVDYAYTNSKGKYDFKDLPTGAVYIAVESSYPTQYIGGTDDIDIATPIVITAPGSSRVQDISLFAGGSISGTVRDETTGRVVSNIPVSASKRPLEWSSIDFSVIDPDNLIVTSKKGTYTLPGLTPGSYDITYGGVPGLFSNSPYLTTNKTAYLSGTSGVTQNATVTKGTKVAGTVTAQGEPLPYAFVVAYPVSGGVFDPYTSNGEGVYYAVTNEAGKYSLYAAPGEYVLQFIDLFGGNGSIYYGGSQRPSESTHVVVTTTAQSGIDGALAPYAGSVTGTLMGAYDESAESFVALVHTPLGGGEESYSTFYSESDANDVFPITGLEDGDYEIYVDAMDYDASLVGYEGNFTIDPDHRSIDLGDLQLGERQPIEWIDSGNNGAAPSLSSTTPQVGDMLSVDEGGWTEDISGFSYQWLRNGKPIIAAIESTYVVQPGDAGKKLSVRVVPFDEENVLFFGETAVSNETAAVAKGEAASLLVAPSVSGTTRVGQTLTVSTGEWDLPGLSYSYRWLRTTGATTAVVGTTSSYKLTTKDVAATLSVEVTASRLGFDSASVSMPVAAVVPSTALKLTKKSTLTITETGYSITPGTWTPKPSSVTYQWRVDGTAIEGATSATFSSVLPGQVSVIVTAAKSGYASTSVEVLASPLEWIVDPTAAAGPNQVGYPLTVNLSPDATKPTATGYTFQWLRDGKAIKGATKDTFVPTLAGGVITAAVTGVRGPAKTDVQRTVGFGTTLAASGSFTANVTLDSGAATVGRPVTAKLEDVTLTGTKTTWKWYRQIGDADPVAIAKATKASYTPTTADLGHILSATATVSRTGYDTNIAHAETGVVALTAADVLTQPSLPRGIKVGAAVKASPGTWNLSGVTYSYRWLLNGYEIPGATASSYTPRAEDADEELSVEVTANRSGFPSSSPATSTTVTVGLGVAPKATKAPVVTVSGKVVTTVTGSKVLVSTLGTWTTPGTTRSLRWEASLDGVVWETVQADGNASLTVTSAPGTKLRSVVTATKAGYESGLAYSKVVTVK